MACFSRGVFFLLAILLCCEAITLDLEEKQKEERARQASRENGREGAAEDKPGTPQNLALIPQGPNAMAMTWQKPSSNDTVHYLVYVDGTELQDTTEIPFYIWKGLEACTSYTFGVMAVSSSDLMSDPALADGETDADRPPEPQNLRVESSTYNAVTLAWEKPATPCDIEHYRVIYQAIGSPPDETQVNEPTVEVSQLTPETLYTFSVFASTSEGEGPAASINQTTSVGTGPPQNLVAEGISSSAINVSWFPPGVPPEYYQITVYKAGIYDERVFAQQYLIEGLQPCTTCDITVSSYYTATGKSFPATVRSATNDGVPPAPKTCSAVADENFITVKWEKPTTSCALGDYRVDWTVKKLWGDGKEESHSTNKTGDSYTVYTPPPYHNYTFNIAASVNGIFGDSTSCSVNSLETSAGPPVNVSVEAEDQGEVRVTWEPPTDENGEIIQYGIFVDNSPNPMQVVDGEVRTTSVFLESCVTFLISVAARNHADKNDGWGQRSEAQEETSPGDVLPQEMECNIAGPDVQACWSPYSTDCPVSHYNLEWEGNVLWSTGTIDWNSTTLNWSNETMCYNISSIPYTRYRVSLSVGTDTHKSITCSSTSPMAAPGPPTLEDCHAEDFTIIVTWKEPVKKNGVISNYMVEWKDWNDYVNSTVTDANTFSYEIVLNSCGGKVDVTVSAKTADFDGFGKRSQPESVFLVNSISQLSCSATVPGEIALNWELQDSKCPVDYYNVTWTLTSLWSNTKDSGSLSINGSDSSTTLKELYPYSDVSVEVQIINSPKTYTCSNTTLQEASDAPTNLHQIENNTNSATVTWDNPKNVRGELLSWHLTWNTEDDNTQVGTEDVSSETMTYQIEGLSSSGTYVVSVMAVNGAGRGEPGTTTVKTAHENSAVQPTSLGLILGVSIGVGVLLILLAIGGCVIYNKKHQTKPPRPAPFMPDVIDSNIDGLYKKQHVSSVNQRLQGEGETIDFGTNRELYPYKNKDSDHENENNTVDKHTILPKPLSGRQPSVPINRESSQMVNNRMRGFEEYNRRSSQPVISVASDQGRRPSHHGIRDKPNLGEFVRRPSQQVDLGKRNLKDFRPPSQQIEPGRHNMNEFARRSSQQIIEHRPRPVDHGRRFSQQIEPGRSRLGQDGRRPSQQVDLGRSNLREYNRRPSQQIDIGRSNLREYSRRPSQQIDLARREYERRASQQIEMGRLGQEEFPRRPSQQVGISGGSVPSRAPQPPVPPRSGYEDYRRRPSQQTDIGLPSDRAFVRRPSQQFVTNFEGIKE